MFIIFIIQINSTIGEHKFLTHPPHYRRKVHLAPNIPRIRCVPGILTNP